MEDDSYELPILTLVDTIKSSSPAQSDLVTTSPELRLAIKALLLFKDAPFSVDDKEELTHLSRVHA